MAANQSSNPTPSAGEPSTAPLPIPFEDRLNEFWKNNRALILGACALIILGVLANGIWERMQASKDLEVQKAYAAASTPEQLRAFASSHSGHPLAGVAEIRVADEAYAAGRAADAAAGYDKALSVLKDGPLAARAKLGRALSRIQSGKAAEGEAELKQIAGDANQLNAIRAEAAYNLASLAADAGNTADVQKYVEQLNQIDPASIWARRALPLLANLPVPAAPAAPAAPGGPAVDVKLPGK